MGNIIPLSNAKNQRAASDLLSARSDDDLMLLARGGMNEAFDELVRRHQQRVIRIAMKYLGDETDARDITQNSFVEVYRYLQNYKPAGKFVSFLATITVNQCRMRMRSKRYEQKAYYDLEHQQPSRNVLPEDQLLAREQRREVEKALGQISIKLRETLILRYAGELSYDEIAKVLNIRLGTVKSRLFSGLAKLTKMMEVTDE